MYYCVETDEDPEGVIEPVFTNEGLNNITQAFSRIMEAVRDTTDQDQLQKSRISHQVWSHKGFTISKKGHILAKIPVLGSLTHLCQL